MLLSNHCNVISYSLQYNRHSYANKMLNRRLSHLHLAFANCLRWQNLCKNRQTTLVYHFALPWYIDIVICFSLLFWYEQWHFYDICNTHTNIHKAFDIMNKLQLNVNKKVTELGQIVSKSFPVQFGLYSPLMFFYSFQFILLSSFRESEHTTSASP